MWILKSLKKVPMVTGDVYDGAEEGQVEHSIETIDATLLLYSMVHVVSSCCD